MDKRNSGVELVKYSGKISPLNVFCKCRYASQILNLEKEISGFVGSIPVDLLLNVRKLMAELKDVYTELKPPDICSTPNETICKQAFMLRNDACQNTTSTVGQIRLDNLCESVEIEEVDTLSYHNTAAMKSQFYVGLENSVWNMKELLFKSEISVVGVHSMEGCRKTSLALASCDDPHIKGESCFYSCFSALLRNHSGFSHQCLKILAKGFWSKPETDFGDDMGEDQAWNMGFDVKISISRND